MNGRTDIAENVNFGGTWHVNGAKIQKSDLTKFRYCSIVSYATIKFNLATKMAKEIEFENGDFSKFKGSVTLTLTLDVLENLRMSLVRFVSSTSVHITIVHMNPLSLIVTGRRDGRTDGRTDIFPLMPLGHFC